ncbi:acetoacetate--CoA ligase [Nocardioides sp. NBC_00368]|uniref:acetoacetate--CoA ligase n=1 Tax=Nocardioides sp. NBC_00368 TaxID=2976000 RepID=UPI002E1E4877
MSVEVGDVIWRPHDERIEGSEFRKFTKALVAEGLLGAADPTDYLSVWRWSVENPAEFWRALAKYVRVDVSAAGDSDIMPGKLGAEPEDGRWFPGVSLNYAAVALAQERRGDAIIGVDEDGTRHVLSWRELRTRVGALAGFLRDAGVRPGDRVAAVLPNRAEAVIGLLASASVGAVWSVVAPEFGASAIVSRLQQLQPVVLLATAAYDYNGRSIDRGDVLREVIAGLPDLREIVWVGEPVSDPQTPARSHRWDDVIAVERPWVADAVDFNHPLWVLFSSGTTGVPKGIVHGHGGVVLEELKTLTLHTELSPGDRFFVVGSTSWVVWNTLASGLLRGATIVLLDGNPAYPSLERVWQVAAHERVSVLGVGAAYLHSCMRAGLMPGTNHDLAALRMMQVTGSPLSPDAYNWAYESLGEVWLASVSGGTDIAGIFIGGAPTEPVRVGRLQPPALGVAAAAWNAEGEPVTDEAGELVITVPMPSMPLRFWNDPDGSRYRSSYFETYPGVWRHGDLVEFGSDGSSVIVGRSDSTLNRNGIRFGPADLYRVVEALPEVKEAMVVGVEKPEGYYMPLFVALETDADEDAVAATIRNAIRGALSPRYVPDEIIVLSAIPHTRTGKKLEVPVKRILMGAAVDDVVDIGSVDSVAVLHEVHEVARRRVPA